jgi:hypothetical protein
MDAKYSLQKYGGASTRHTCPNCGDKKSLALYVDALGNILDSRVGKCNHESGCGYHYPPKQFFIDHPDKSDSKAQYGTNGRKPANYKPQPQKREVRPLYFIDREVMAKSINDKNGLFRFIADTFSRWDALCVMGHYNLGSTKDGRVIYWQIDNVFQKEDTLQTNGILHKGGHGRVRTGKVMKYNPDGHRDKQTPPTWIHALMKKQGLLPDNWELTQCLFGEHLLNIYPDKPVCIVESEKTAVLCTLMFPTSIWLATGGMSQLSVDKMKVLAGRSVTFFPDTDTEGKAYHTWKDKVEALTKEIRFASYKVSDILEKKAIPEEKAKSIDIGDWIVAAWLRLKEENPNRQTPLRELYNNQFKANGDNTRASTGEV